MLELTIPDMTCGHCVKTITGAIGEIDSAAKLDFDLSAHRISIASGKDPAAIRAAIENAGYTVSGAAPGGTDEASCCGSCHT